MCIGARRAKSLIVVLLCVEAVLALSFTHKPWLAPILALSTLWFVLDNALLWRDKPYATWQAALFFMGWNVFLLMETAFSFAFSRGQIGFFGY